MARPRSPRRGTLQEAGSYSSLPCEVGIARRPRGLSGMQGGPPHQGVQGPASMATLSHLGTRQTGGSL